MKWIISRLTMKFIRPLFYDNIEGTKIVSIIGIISSMILCGNSFALHSEHPSLNDANLLNV
jgi:hypothetical protein